MRSTDRLSSKVGASKTDIVSSFEKAAKQRDKPKKNKPDCRITVRFTQDEQTQVKRNADGTNLSAHIRSCVLNRGGLRKNMPAKDREAIAQILGTLGQSRIANNLNQIAHHANCGSLLLDEKTEQDINLACAHIAWMRIKLIEALGLKDGSKR